MHDSLWDMDARAGVRPFYTRRSHTLLQVNAFCHFLLGDTRVKLIGMTNVQGVVVKEMCTRRHAGGGVLIVVCI
jgi:hypothetical protein